MMIERDIAWVDELRRSGKEDSCVEFKRNNDDPDMIGKLVSAMSNAARIESKEVACILWGIEDAHGAVTGTTFDPNAKKVGGQAFELRLAQMLRPSVAFAFRTVHHPQGKVVLLEIPAATSAPVEYAGVAYVRIGNATPKLGDYPDRFQKLIVNLRPYVWEKASAQMFVEDDVVLDLLDYPAYFRLTGQSLPGDKAGILARLEADRLIGRDVGNRWNITNLGAILFASDLRRFDESLSRKAVRFVAYDGRDRASTVTHRRDGRMGYASGFEGLVTFIDGLLPKVERIGPAFREVKEVFPPIAIRELIANALVHQDMTVQGAGPQIALFTDRLEITNPGESLVSTDRMIDLPPRARNAMLGTLMRRMRLCEEQGSGMDKVLLSVEDAHLPPFKLQAEEGFTQVILYGPRSYADMTPTERVRACYQHAVRRWLSGDRMRNASLCDRLGIDRRNAAQVSGVIRQATEENRIKPADPDHPRAGYHPFWA